MKSQKATPESKPFSSPTKAGPGRPSSNKKIKKLELQASQDEILDDDDILAEDHE